MKNSILFLFLITTLLFQSCSKDSNSEETKPDVVAPTISFSIAGFSNTTSSEPIVVSNQIEVTIDAQDAGGIAKIEAFIDNQKVGEDTSAPYSIIIDVSTLSSKTGKISTFKNYTLKITATDIAGNSQSTEQIINVDNEKPSITAVTLSDGSIINGDTNVVSFEVMDNEELVSVKAFLNDELLLDVPLDDLSININSNNLTDGQNTLKLEAKDSGDNTGVFEVNFVSDNTGPEITLESLVANQILDAEILLSPAISDTYSTVAFAEIVLDGNSLQSFPNPETINLDFDPENYSVGEHQLQITAQDNLGNTSSIEIPFDIYRRMITINIPEGRLNPAIVLPVVFLSRMDGSLLVHQEILKEDRQIILRIAEEFDMNTEFMVSFYLQDNGSASGISTHQNITRSNLGVINLAEAKRLEAELGMNIQVPTANFFSQDFLLGGSASSFDSFVWNSAESAYFVYLNTSVGNLEINTAELASNAKPFDSYYVYETGASYTYALLDSPIDANFILDKANMRTDNVTDNNFTIATSHTPTNPVANLQLYGALTQEDDMTNRYHRIYNFNLGANAGDILNYKLNTLFSHYRHSLNYDNYHTERNGTPPSTYSIPNVSVDYTTSNNVVNLNIQGTEHVLGRVEFVDDTGPVYVWNIAFNSQTTTSVVIPELPPGINHPVKTAYENNTIQAESVHLYSYESINSYSEYLQNVVKDHKNVLDVTDWFQLIYASDSGFHKGPIDEFGFQ